MCHDKDSTDQVFVLTSLDFFGHSVLSNLHIIFCFLFTKPFHEAMLTRKTDRCYVLQNEEE